MTTFDNDFLGKISDIFYCKKCNYNTSIKYNFKIHLQSIKHKNNNLTTNNNDNLVKICKQYICQTCNKIFNDRTGLWRHNKKCNNIESCKPKLEENIKCKNEVSSIDKDELIIELLKQNKELLEIVKNGTQNIIHTNSHNKTFNLQVFLNEKCKDALNVSEFVNSLKLTLEDLENVGEKGFVDGISRIFINGLKNLDVYKRPIHCSDLKREIIHLKNENVWEKDNENKEQMKKVIKQIANKNIKKIYEWKDKYPDCKYSDSKKNDQYSRIIIESMGARTIEEDQLLYEKIIKNIAKQVTIDKINN